MKLSLALDSVQHVLGDGRKCLCALMPYFHNPWITQAAKSEQPLPCPPPTRPLPPPPPPLLTQAAQEQLQVTLQAQHNMI